MNTLPDVWVRMNCNTVLKNILLQEVQNQKVYDDLAGKVGNLNFKFNT